MAWGIRRTFEADWYAGTADREPQFGEVPAAFGNEDDAEARATALWKRDGDEQKYMVLRLYAAETRGEVVR